MAIHDLAPLLDELGAHSAFIDLLIDVREQTAAELEKMIPLIDSLSRPAIADDGSLRATALLR
jgi:hypothetical protein